jgi:hypothetical protein
MVPMPGYLMSRLLFLHMPIFYTPVILLNSVQTQLLYKNCLTTELFWFQEYYFSSTNLARLCATV